MLKAAIDIGQALADGEVPAATEAATGCLPRPYAATGASASCFFDVRCGASCTIV
jgi:hypothetical protein